MSKTMTMFALVAGGAATYAWIRKSGGTDQVESQVESAVRQGA